MKIKESVPLQKIVFGALIAASCVMIYLLVTGPNVTDLAFNSDNAKKVNEKLYQKPVLHEGKQQQPKSLEGLNQKQNFEIDSDSNLVISETIKDMFEYYLSSLGEVDLETVIGLIHSEINNELEGNARDDALYLLKRYIDYKIELVDFKTSWKTETTDYTDTETLIETQNALKEFRQNFFSSAEYDAFFAEEDAYHFFMIEQLRINHDESLSETEKGRQLQQAQLLLPDEMRESRERAQAHSKISQEVADIRKEGGTDSDIYNLRASKLGADAASALAKLDIERAKWQQRLDDFSEARIQVMHSGLSETDKNESIEILIAEHFHTNEHLRVRALMNDGRLDM